MAFRIRPVEGTFFEQFSALAEHAATGADLLAEMLADDCDRAGVLEGLTKCKREADLVTHRLIKQVNATFVTPFDHEDVYRLTLALDHVMDQIEQAGALIELYQVNTLLSEFSSQVEVLQRCAEVTTQVMPRLRALRGIEEYWIEIHRLENLGDTTHRRVLGQLFDGSRKALEVIRLKDISAALEGAVDAFEQVANIVEQIAVKES
ncbi:MAG: DUF47 family protein [Nocardioides sp.]